jgi:hypothetical protein
MTLCCGESGRATHTAFLFLQESLSIAFLHGIFLSIARITPFLGCKDSYAFPLLSRVYEPVKKISSPAGSILFHRPLQAGKLLSFGSTKRLYGDSGGTDHLKKKRWKR